MIDALRAVSPVDGRYGKITEKLGEIAGEGGLIRYRIQVEVEWIIALSECEQISELPEFSREQKEKLRALYKEFDNSSALKVKEIEARTNHDVKAVEYFLKEAVENILPEKSAGFFHFACTSEDINSSAYALMSKDLTALAEERISAIFAILKNFSEEWKNIPMLCRTHGQPASPSLLGKEMGVFLARLNGQTEFLREVKFMAKMSGAVGNFNAHFAAYPEVDWFALSRKVLEDRLGVTFNPVTTQIEPHDNLADLLDIFSRISTILIDFARDIWLYISMNYFGQKLNIGEVGSSTMPHKVNPIDFENAEGNLLLARNLLRFLADKLPLSRLQRDLTDSTVLRNLGQAFAYLFIAFASLEKGMGKLKVNREVIAADLENHYEVLAEPVQTVMKRYGIGDAYEQLKELTRGEKITREKLQSFISGLNIPEKAKEQLLSLTPEKYTGIVK